MQFSDVLDFWFSDAVRAKWFKPDEAFDRELESRFGELSGMARSGALTSWAGPPEGALALVILLDQIPRNIFRGTPEAFSGDARALEIAEAAIDLGHDARLEPMQRYMLYMPFMHSENLEAQERGMELFERLGLEEPLRYMKMHRDVVARFGRFPHRNAILGRESTSEELEFLSGPNSSF